MPKSFPTSEIGDQEIIGRRLMDEPLMLMPQGLPAPKRKPHEGLLLTSFEQRPGETEYSLDRLGRQGNAEPSVVRYLVPRAQAVAATFHKPKRFCAWATLKAKSVRGQQWDFVASPEVLEPQDERSLKNNVYHAHVNMPPNIEPYWFALMFRDLVERVIDSEGKPLELDLLVAAAAAARSGAAQSDEALGEQEE